MDKRYVIIKSNPKMKFTLMISDQEGRKYLIESEERHETYDVPYYLAWHDEADLVFAGGT